MQSFWIKDNPDVAQRQGEEALLSAAARGDSESVKALLAWVHRSNARYSAGGDTPLMCAMRYGHKETARLLLESGRSEPRAQTIGGDCAAAIAARSEDIAMLSLLAGPFDEAPGVQNALNILFFAVEHSRTKAAIAAVATRERAAGRDAMGRTPLIAFCAKTSHPSPRDARFLLSLSDANARARRGPWSGDDALAHDEENRFADMAALDAAIEAKNWPLARALWPASNRDTRQAAALRLMAKHAGWTANHPQYNPIDRLLDFASDEELVEIMVPLRRNCDALNAHKQKWTSAGPWRTEEMAPKSHARWLALHEAKAIAEEIKGAQGDREDSAAASGATPARSATRL